MGVNYLRTIVEGANCIFHEIHKENDFGNDAIIELVEHEEVKGICIAVQVKSGSSYCTNSTCSIPADRAHFEYWLNHSLPVIGVVYDPSEKLAYWFNIKDYIKDHKNLVSTGPYSITFEKDEVCRLNEKSFIEIFLPTFLKQPIILDFSKSIEWANSIDYEKHLIGLTSLFYAYRDETKVWDIFLEMLKNRPREDTHPKLIYLLSLIPGHLDIFWTPQNRITEEIKGYVKKQMGQFNKSEILKLLSFIDENGTQRGSIGQCVTSIVNVVENRRQILEEISLDCDIDFDLRTYAIWLFIENEKDGVALLLSRLLEADPETQKFARQIIRGFDLTESLEYGYS